MKKQWLMVLAAFLTTAAISKAQVPSYVEVSPDIGLSLQAAFPDVGDYDLYENGLTAEVQFRDWFNQPWGYLLSIGYGEWSTDSGATSPGANLYDYDGSLETIPFGASILYQFYNVDNLSAALDFGVRYLSTDSSVTARNSDDATGKRYDVEFDDAIIYRFGVSADYILSSSCIWSVGAGYQNDITKAEISTELGPARDNILEAFYIETAFRLPL